MSALYGRAVALADLAEDQHLAGAEDVRRQPVEGRPVDRQSQVRLLLPREAADRRAVEGQVVRRLEQELLVIVQHVQPAFEVGEAHGDRLDALLVVEIAHPLFADHVGGPPGQPLLLGLEVHLLQLVVGDLQKVAQPRMRGARRRPRHLLQLLRGHGGERLGSARLGWVHGFPPWVGVLSFGLDSTRTNLVVNMVRLNIRRFRLIARR